MTKLHKRKSSLPQLKIEQIEGRTFDAVIAWISTFKGRLELRVRSNVVVVFTCDDNWPNDVTSTFIVTLKNKVLLDTHVLVDAITRWNSEVMNLAQATLTRHEPKLKT